MNWVLTDHYNGISPAFCVLMLYFSYAANLNRSHMAHLCPGAEPLFTTVLQGYVLTVRRWFNIEPQEGSEVVGGIWRLREEHLSKLDWYEDCPALYERREISVLPLEHGRMGAWAHGGRGNAGVSSPDLRILGIADEQSHGHSESRIHGDTDARTNGSTDTRTDDLLCLVYLMERPFQIPLSSPDPEYLEMVREGYREWGISSGQLERALQRRS